MCLHQQLQRLAPLPSGITIQPRSRTSPDSSQFQRETTRCGTRHGPSRDSHTTSVFTPTHISKTPVKSLPCYRHKHSATSTTFSTTFKDYVTTLPTQEHDHLFHATEKPSTILLYEMLTQSILLNWPSAMAVPMNLKTTAPSVGYLAPTRNPMGIQKHRTRLLNAILPHGRVWSPLLTFVSYTLPALPGNSNN
jgi:hypothetical protein